MKCLMCKKEMVCARENYNYAACGLPHITLRGIEVHRCVNCGEYEVEIPKITDLHQTIALTVIAKKSRLTAEEIKYLRRHLDWSGIEFARHMRVTTETVSRWENGHEPIGVISDQLLRSFIIIKSAKPYDVNSLVEVENKTSPTFLQFTPARKGWQPEPVAA